MDNMGHTQEATQVFQQFMAKCLELEHMQKFGGQFLSLYHSNLEVFRRPPLNETSKVVADLLKKSSNGRIMRYQEAGCHHFHIDQQAATKLESSHSGLQDHIEKARKVISELQGLVRREYCLLQEDLSQLMNRATITSASDHVDCHDEKEGAADDREKDDHIIGYAGMMATIFRMLEQDFEMQEKIVEGLNLNASSEQLQNYCLFWTLRPYIDETLVEKALSWSHG